MGRGTGRGRRGARRSIGMSCSVSTLGNEIDPALGVR